MTCSFVKFGCLFGIFLSSVNLICRSTDTSKCFRGSLRLQENESRLLFQLGKFYLKIVICLGYFKNCRKENSPSSSRFLVQGIYWCLNATFCTLLTMQKCATVAVESWVGNTRKYLRLEGGDISVGNIPLNKRFNGYKENQRIRNFEYLCKIAEF